MHAFHAASPTLAGAQSPCKRRLRNGAAQGRAKPNSLTHGLAAGEAQDALALGVLPLAARGAQPRARPRTRSRSASCCWPRAGPAPLTACAPSASCRFSFSAWAPLTQVRRRLAAAAPLEPHPPVAATAAASPGAQYSTSGAPAQPSAAQYYLIVMLKLIQEFKFATYIFRAARNMDFAKFGATSPSRTAERVCACACLRAWVCVWVCLCARACV